MIFAASSSLRLATCHEHGWGADTQALLIIHIHNTLLIHICVHIHAQTTLVYNGEYSNYVARVQKQNGNGRTKRLKDLFQTEYDRWFNQVLHYWKMKSEENPVVSLFLSINLSLKLVVSGAGWSEAALMQNNGKREKMFLNWRCFQKFSVGFCFDYLNSATCLQLCAFNLFDCAKDLQTFSCKHRVMPLQFWLQLIPAVLKYHSSMGSVMFCGYLYFYEKVLAQPHTIRI